MGNKPFFFFWGVTLKIHLNTPISSNCQSIECIVFIEYIFIFSYPLDTTTFMHPKNKSVFFFSFCFDKSTCFFSLLLGFYFSAIFDEKINRSNSLYFTNYRSNANSHLFFLLFLCTFVNRGAKKSVVAKWKKNASAA